MTFIWLLQADPENNDRTMTGVCTGSATRGPSMFNPVCVLPSRCLHPGNLSHMFLHELNPLFDGRTNHQFILSTFEFTLGGPLESEDFFVFLAACQTKILRSPGTNLLDSQEQRTPESAPLACLGRGRPFGGCKTSTMAARTGHHLLGRSSPELGGSMLPLPTQGG